MNVDEAVTLDSTLDVTGDTSVSTFDSTGATSLATGGGAVNVASTGVMTTVKGTLNVDEAVTLDSTLDVSGVITGNVTGNVTGDVTGDVSGNLTGNVTGNLTGNVTGNLTGNVTASGRIITDDTTDATSTTDGSIQTDGGLSVVKDIVVGDDIKLLSDSAILSLGSGSDVTIAHNGSTGLDLDSAGGIDVDAVGSLTLDSAAGSITMGAILADGQNLKLGKNGAVEVIISPHSTAANEKYSVTNTAGTANDAIALTCLLYTSPSPRDRTRSRMPSSA